VIYACETLLKIQRKILQLKLYLYCLHIVESRKKPHHHHQQQSRANPPTTVKSQPTNNSQQPTHQQQLRANPPTTVNSQPTNQQSTANPLTNSRPPTTRANPPSHKSVQSVRTRGVKLLFKKVFKKIEVCTSCCRILNYT